MLTLYILAFLAGAPAGHEPQEFPYTLTPSPAGKVNDPVPVPGLQPMDCLGPYALKAAQHWAELHPGYTVVGTRCRVAKVELPA